MPRALPLCLLVSALVLSACSGSPAAPATPTRSAAPATAPVALPTPAASPTTDIATPVSAPPPAAGTPVPPTPESIPPEATALVQEALGAVARETGVPVAQVAVVSVQMVEWGDASLGCPEAGMEYAQMATPGYLIRLSAGGKAFEYHTDREGTVITCASPQPPARVEQ